MSEYPQVGLALGGGASRGLAHIGVLKALHEHRVPVDMISGCSMGAVVGSIYANGCTVPYLEGISLQLSAMDSRRLYDIGVPRRGFIKGNRIISILYTLLSDKTFEELNLPFCCIATCLEDAKLITFSTGRVLDAVRASISVPGVFEPVIIDDKLYVDGGVMDRVPVDAVRAMGADFIIAVDVGYQGTSRTRPKNLLEVLYCSYEMMEWQANRRVANTADILIAPDTMQINPAVLTQAEECIQLGYDATLARMPDLLTKLTMANIPLRKDA
ncbi:MAG: patatin-like phospholipase family protein [Eubacteriales bacterium]|nr:patatin-like phospholipase family protein [Eubacteriales bacterium]